MAIINQLLEIVKDFNASDLHLTAGSVPVIRVNGRLEKTRHHVLTSENIKQLFYEILTDEQIRRFEKEGDLDFAYGIANVGRFRLNIYRMHSGLGASVRLIPDHLPDLATLGFPESVGALAESKSGLVLITGPTNSGKTTTLASIVDHINTNSSKHIITLEDPIEYVHTGKNSLVSQRQIGLHSASFATALRAALREDPDVVLVGEMRDLETIALALSAAETGLLVFGTLHTTSAAGTIDRVVDVFPADQQQQVRIMLADTLVGIVCQQLLKRADGSGRVMAYELMVRTTSVANIIREGKTHQLPNIMLSSRGQGMRLLDNHLRALVDAGIVTAQEAARVAAEPAQFYSKTPDKEHQTAGTA